MVVVQRLAPYDVWPFTWRVFPSETEKLTLRNMENMLDQMERNVDDVDSSGRFSGAVPRYEWEELLKSVEEIVEQEMYMQVIQQNCILTKLVCLPLVPAPLAIARHRILTEVLNQMNLPDHGRIRRKVMWSIELDEDCLVLQLHPRPGFATWLKDHPTENVTHASNSSDKRSQKKRKSRTSPRSKGEMFESCALNTNLRENSILEHNQNGKNHRTGRDPSPIQKFARAIGTWLRPDTEVQKYRLANECKQAIRPRSQSLVSISSELSLGFYDDDDDDEAYNDIVTSEGLPIQKHLEIDPGMKCVKDTPDTARDAGEKLVSSRIALKRKSHFDMHISNIPLTLLGITKQSGAIQLNKKSSSSST